MTTEDRLIPSTIPVSFFGMAVGTLALANAWRIGARLWSLPPGLPNAFTALGVAVWLTLLIAYARKWRHAPQAARAELADPMQSSFAALLPVSTLLAAIVMQPYAPELALAIVVIASPRNSRSACTCTGASGRAADHPNW